MACHADLETDALVLADPCGSSAKDTTLALQPSTLANRQHEIEGEIQTLKIMKALGPTALAEMFNKEDGTSVWTPEKANKLIEDRIEDRLRELKKAVPKPASKASDLSMLEVQGSEGAQGVRLAPGATVVLSACDTGRGEIKAEGVVGLSRGFLLANASAAVVSLWSVDDGSTAALMRIKYAHLAKGCTVAQALRLAMLRLARRPQQKLGQKQTRDRAAGAAPAPLSHASQTSEASQDGHCDELDEAWKQPFHWAAFLVVGATTSLPRHSPNIPQDRH
jgi:hypothetical protein